MLRVLVPFVSLLLSLHLFAAGHDLSPTAARQLRPVVTANGSGLTAAWIEETGAPKRRVLAGRVSAGGQPLDGAGIQLDQSLATSIAIAHSSSEALIVWGTSEGVVAARLSPFGSVLDPLPILIARQPFPSIAVAWNGERYFVLWTDSFELFGAFVSREGTMTSPMQLGSQSALRHYLSAPDVAWDGHQFIVVFSEVVIEGQVQCGECPQPAPDHVNVMRVSANGDAIDAIPIRIPGLHVRAHVASSGAESLIALDSDSDTSTMVVREENGGLQLAPEAPLLHWFSNIGSAVAWDGSTYSVAWRSPTWANTPGWLGVSRITPAGDALLSLVTTVGPADYSQPMTPSVTASDTGEIVLVAAEMVPLSSVSHARFYRMAELAPPSPAPAAPHDVVSHFSGSSALVEWQSDAGASGFLIEESNAFGVVWFPVAVTSDVRSTTVPFAAVGNLLRVSAFGPGRLSAAAVTSITSPPRRRVSR